MTRTIRRVLLYLLLLIAAALNAQISSQSAGVEITLGQSAVPLYGPWKFQVGDSPMDPKTGKLLWAEPGFDDSKWETVDLTPKNGAFDAIGGATGYVPGWTAKGHPGYWGYAWYRIRVHLDTPPGERLALAGPADVDDAYQVFNNGEMVGSFGDFSRAEPVVYFSRPKMFPLPQAGSHGAGTSPEESTRVLAFRVWMLPSSLIQDPDAGGLHTAPVVGEAGVVAAGYQMRWLEVVRTYASAAAQALVFGLLAGVAFSLILFDRSDRVYLWMGALFLLYAVVSAHAAIASWTELLGVNISLLLRRCT